MFDMRLLVDVGQSSKVEILLLRANRERGTGYDLQSGFLNALWQWL